MSESATGPTHPSSAAAAPESGWLDTVKQKGGVSPLLIVADSCSTASQARFWDQQLTSAGWVYRVRLGEVAGQWQDREAAAVACEATSLAARSILAVGGDQVIAVATAAARLAGLPLVAISAD